MVIILVIFKKLDLEWLILLIWNIKITDWSNTDRIPITDKWSSICWQEENFHFCFIWNWRLQFHPSLFASVQVSLLEKENHCFGRKEWSHSGGSYYLQHIILPASPWFYVFAHLSICKCYFNSVYSDKVCYRSGIQ